MATRHDTKSYDTLTNQDTNPFAAGDAASKRSPTIIDEEETPQSSGLVIHVVPETNKGEYLGPSLRQPSSLSLHHSVMDQPIESELEIRLRIVNANLEGVVR